VPHVRELVCEHALELGRRARGETACADGDRRAARPATGGERQRQPVRDEIEPRLHDSAKRGEPLDGRVQKRRLADRQLARADHPEHDAVERPVRADDEQQAGEDEDREDAEPAELPAHEREHAADTGEQQPGLEDVAGGDEAHVAAPSDVTGNVRRAPGPRSRGALPRPRSRP